MARFAHLHLHSQYSLLDGANRLDLLVKRVAALGMDSVAVTDHGNLYGAVDFYSKAKSAGLKPILGIEAYVAPDVEGRKSDRTDRTYTGVSDGGFHLVLLARTLDGWRNLVRLSSDAFVNGFYYRPRMDKGTLTQWSGGLIAINGHLGSSIAFHLTNYVQSKDPRHWHLALDEARWHAEVFGPDEHGEPSFFVELQRHIPEQEAINPHLVRLARELDLPLVCDNDSHFLLAEDWDSHDSLVCIALGKIKEDANRLKYPRDLYVKSPDEMALLFEDYLDGAGEEALVNTVRIADRCAVELPLDDNHAPVVKVVLRPELDAQIEALPRGSSAWLDAVFARYELLPFDAAVDHDSPDDLKAQCDATLRALAEAGLVWRYGDDATDEMRQRLDRELRILADKSISSYFLIVWDFVKEARRTGIPASARGSGVGTMVGYCLGLSNACPVRYGLLFERFTDPDRSEYPDIDIDICQDGRGAILDYVRDKYDPNKLGTVAQIITFNVLKAKAAIRDVGRVLDVPLSEVDKVAKLVGDQLNITLDEALTQNAELAALYKSSDLHRRWIDTARKVEGLARHAGVHAAGVVIGNQPLANVLPLAINKQGDKDTLVTQWDGPTCEKVGLLKMDFLGLRTLSIIERARQLVKSTLSEETIRATVDPKGHMPASWDPLDLDRVRLDDQRVLDLFRRGDTVSVFQFESDGMRRLLRAMAPDRFEDLIAANALYRPGPMELIDTYNARKHGREQVPKVHEIVDRFTAETYGIMVYQEQVMQIVHELGGIPLRAAYTLIKAISKKKDSVINAQRAKFVEGAQRQGLTKRDAEGLFDLILKFAGYGFNKSHSTGYAMVAFQTAFLKTYFPVQYMSAVLTYESVSTEKVAKYIEEAGRMSHGDHLGIAVRPPDVNISGIGFTPAFDRGETRDPSHGHIRFGLGAIRGVGSKAVQAILEAREEAGSFKDLFDFCERVPANAANKTTIEALVKCGAFDSIHGCEARAALLEAIEGAIARGHRAAADRRTGQTNLFDLLSPGPTTEPETCRLPDTPPWTASETLREEKAVLGFYVSSHPLEQHGPTLERYSTARACDLTVLPVEADVTIGGLVTNLRKVTARRGRMQGQTMGIVTLEDPSGPFEVVAFPAVWAKVATLIAADQLVFVRGKVKERDGQRSIALDSVVPLELADSLAVGCRIRLPEVLQCPLDASLLSLFKELRGLLLDAGSSNGGSVPLRLELPLHGQLVVIAAGVSRVAATASFAQRVDDLLAIPGACRFLGPARLAPTAGPGSSIELSMPPLVVGFDDAWELGAPN